MVEPIRLTAQMRQEQISRSQLRERLAEFGWVPVAPPDLGEDFIVHIYLQGRATGVTFHVQQKSVTNLKERRNGDYVVYDFEVKDLKHWEAFSQPVVLVVWDIAMREGRWVLIDTAVPDLDQRRPDWRANKSTARVYIPWNNTTDHAGLLKLQQSIGRHFYPLIAEGKLPEIHMDLSYPDTEEGRTARTAFERFLREGEQASIRGEFFQKLRFSEWWMRWSGDFDLENVRVIIGPSTSPITFLVDIGIIGADGQTASFPNNELRVVKAGKEAVQLSNDHQASPLHFHLTIHDPDKCVKGSFTVNNLGSNVRITRDVMGFLQAVATGGVLMLTFLTLDNASLNITLPPQPEKSPDPEYLQLIDELCMIQEKTGQFIQVPIEGLTDKDVRAISELAAIIKHGKTITKNVSASGEFKGQALEILLEVHRQNKPIHLSLTYDESYVELLGLEIPTGRMTRHVVGTLEMPVAELEQTVAILAPDEYLTLRFVNVEVVEIFPDWFIREAQWLSQRLVENFGARSAYLFGSLAWSDVHAAETDIDLAVPGLPAERYIDAADYLERESSFPVDLVDLGKVSDHLRQRIVTEGKLLGEQEPITAVSG